MLELVTSAEVVPGRALERCDEFCEHAIFNHHTNIGPRATTSVMSNAGASSLPVFSIETVYDCFESRPYLK